MKLRLIALLSRLDVLNKTNTSCNTSFLLQLDVLASYFEYICLKNYGITSKKMQKNMKLAAVT